MSVDISPKQQMLVIEKLYRSNDSITSTRKFNKLHGDKVGKIGYRTVSLNDFYRQLKQAGFKRVHCRNVIKEITDHKPSIY